MGTSFSTSTVLNTGQISVAQAAISVIGSNSQRKTIQLSNTGAVGVAIGTTSAVTATTGFIIPAGAILTLGSHVGPIQAIAASGTNILTFIEESEV